MTDDILLTEIQDRVATLSLNRPAKKNALSPELVDALLAALDRLAADPAVRVVVLRGAGREAFCAGYDIGALPVTEGGGAGRLEQIDPVERLFDAVQRFPYPVIAMLRGAAYGAGCELAVCCDLRLAAEDTRMAMPPARLGLVYPWTGLRRFVNTIGLSATRRLFFTARPVSGEALPSLGLVDALLPAEELEAFTARMAADIAANAPLALKGTKRILYLLQQSVALGAEQRDEAEGLTRASFASRDLAEGRRAFLEKRAPVFEGR